MDNTEHSTTETVRILPDMRICRASYLTESFGKCMVHRPRECTYAMPFGYVYLCGHPDRREIIANTRRLHEGEYAEGKESMLNFETTQEKKK